MANEYFQKQQSVLSAVKTFEKQVRPYLNDDARKHVAEALHADAGTEAKVKVKTSRKTPPAGHGG